MSLIQTPWTSQPQQSVGIQPILPRSPAFLLLPTTRVSNNGKSWEIAPGATFAASQDGIAFKQNGFANAALLHGAPTVASGECYFIAVVNRSSSTTYNTICGLGTTSGFIFGDRGVGNTVGISVLGVNDAAYVTTNNNVTYAVVGSYSAYNNNAYVLARPIRGGEILRGTSGAGSYPSSNGTAYVAKNISPNHFDGDIYLAVGGYGYLEEINAVALLENPWQIFKPLPRRIFVLVSGATGNGTGTGSLSAVTLSFPTGTASGTANATATGSLSTVSLTAPTGAASAGSSATATGSLAASSLSAPSATATGSALATGSLVAVTLSTVAGNATGTTAGSAVGTGAIDSIQIDAPTAIAIASSVATGGFQSIGLTAPTGTASAVDSQNGTAIAALQYIYLVAPTGTASDGTYANAPTGAGPLVIKSNQSRPSQSSMSRPSVKSGGRL